MTDDHESWLRDAAKTPDVVLPEDLAGTTIGRYVVERLLGHGGMGAVHLARDMELDRIVALKVLPARSFGDESRRRRFLREARIAAKLNDPNIATVFDAGEDGERVFLAMEHVDGRTLGAALRADGRMPVGDVLRIGRAVASALSHAHAAGVVHRDVKPDNVMLAKSGAVKVLDFGVAKVAAQEDDSALETRAGSLVGTPAYMSPEQAKGERVDARSDVFSFGVLLYEMLAGARPFEGKTPLDVLIAIDRDKPSSLARARRDIPPWLAAFVMRCLAKDATRRPTDGAALLGALDEGAERSTRPPRAFVPIAAAIAIVAIATIAVMRRDESPPPIVMRPIEPSPAMSAGAAVLPPIVTASSTSAETSASAKAPVPKAATTRAVVKSAASASAPPVGVGPLDEPK